MIADGGTIFMGPEATSYTYRRIRPLKDGIARIALTAARRQKFDSGLVIMPMGSNYSNPTRFRSEIIMNIGQPIHIDSFKEDYKKNKSLAADKIINALRNQLEILTIHTSDEIENQLLRWNEELARNEKIFTSFPEQLDWSKKTIPIIRNIRQRIPKEFESIWHTHYDYFNELKAAGIDDKTLIKNNKGISISMHLIRIVGWPIQLVGKILNFIWYVPLLLFQKMKLYEGYASMVKILTSLVIFPIFYLMLFATLGYWGMKYLVGYIVAALITGLFIRPYEQFMKQYDMKKNALRANWGGLLSKRKKVLDLQRKHKLLPALSFHT